MSDVRVWTIKEGRDKQWVSKGPWIGVSKEINVVPEEDYVDLQKDLCAAKALIAKLKGYFKEIEHVEVGITENLVHQGVTFETLKTDESGKFVTRFPSKEALKEIEEWEKV